MTSPIKRVLMVCEHFLPDEAGTGRFMGELAEEILRQCPRVEIEVLTTNKLYRESVRHELPRAERRDRLYIRRFRSLRTGNDTIMKRLLSDIAFSIRAGCRALVAHYDVIIAVTSPPESPIVLSLLNRLRRKRFVYFIHDLYPDIGIAVGAWRADSLFVRCLKYLQRVSLHSSDKVIVLGRCMKEYLVQNYSVNADRISVRTNWYNIPVDSVGAKESTPDGVFKVVYSGNLGELHDFGTLFGAAECLVNNKRIRFVIAGRGPRREAIQREIQRKGLKNVDLLDFMSDVDYTKLLLSADLGVVSLDTRAEGLAVPSKMYNLLAAGVPLIGIVGKHSEVGRVIEEHRVGYRIDPGDVSGLVRAILRAMEDREEHVAMRSRARRYAVANAAREVVVAQVLRDLFPDNVTSELRRLDSQSSGNFRVVES